MQLQWLNSFNEDGATRHSNAWTNLYTTGYWVEFNTSDHESQLESLLNVVDPWALDEKFMLEERAVIEQEYNIGFAEDPYLTINLERTSALLGKTPFARSVIGTPDAIRKYDLAEARQLHKHSHRLENATLLVTGDSSTEQMAQWLSAMNLPSIDNQNELPDPPRIDLPNIVDEQDVRSRNIPSTFYFEKLVEIESCGNVAQCDITFQILRSVIDSSMQGGIAAALRFDNFIARAFSFHLYSLGDSNAVVSFIAQPDLGISLQTLNDAFVDAWSATSEGGIPMKSFERMRKRIMNKLDNITDKPAHAMGIALDQLMSGKPVYSPEAQRAALTAANYEQIMKLLESLHDNGRLVIRRVSTVDE